MKEKTYYFILSGTYYGLSEGELNALFEIYDIDISKETSLSQLRIIKIKDCDNIIAEIIRRAGSIKEAGEIVSIYSMDESSLEEKIVSDAMSFFNELLDECWVDSKSIKGFGKEYIDKMRLSIARRICRKIHSRARTRLSLVATDGVILLGRVIGKLDTKSFMERKPSLRPFFRSIAMPVQLSRILVNLSRLRPGEVFLDPFCGTGSIVIEAYLVGGKPIGIDINWDIVKGARLNLKHYHMLGSEIILSDARAAKLKHVHAIATDPPYGRSASTYGEDVKKLYMDFISNASNILLSKRYMVFMAPVWLEKYIDEVLCDKGFILRRKYYMYVHSALTRIVYEAMKI
ncbi:RNA methyltransferase [Desulfurococcaceae archaeon MEX13E-LK6-19]|nr:RNA methyltransferase [Desulfurococcaceae archaeon MEX13E-LK6-19]